MIALDTNVLVRFLLRDDAGQARLVYERFRKAELSRERLFVPLVVMLELLWVLESAYELAREDILSALGDLRQMPILEIEADAVIERVLSAAEKTNTDLSDLLIAHSAEASGCESVLTFDKKAARASLFRLLK